MADLIRECGLHTIVAGESPNIDVFAVHGLAANPASTWVKTFKDTAGTEEPVGRVNDKGQREVMWLKDLLPLIIPNARILKFNYASHYFIDAPKEHLRSISGRLVQAIHDLRTQEGDTRERPIIFIGHSFGGIVIEEALVLAYRNEEFRSIASKTCGVVFLGTPLRGSHETSWGVTLANCAAALGLGSDTKLIKTLEPDSDRLNHLLQDFCLVVREVYIELFCFYEIQPLGMLFRKALIVPEPRATIDGVPRISLPANHSTMNKYGSSQDECFKLVSSRLKWLSENAKRIVNQTGKGQEKRYFMVTYPLNKNYTFREEATVRIKKLLDLEGESQTRIALLGLGGIGKTQTALSLAYEMKNTNSAFWVHGASRARFMSEYTSIAKHVTGLGEGLEEAEICAKFKDWLDSDVSGQWCLFIDNVDDPNQDIIQLFRLALPVHRGTIIFTSRNANIVGPLVDPGYDVRLQIMNEAESTTTFFKLSGVPNNEEDTRQLEQVVDLLERLGHLPLAIAQAAAYIRKKHVSIDRYIQMLSFSDEKQAKLLSKDVHDRRSHADVPTSVLNTWEITSSYIQQKEAASWELFQIMSLLDFQNIPRGLVNSKAIRSKLGLLDEIDFEQTMEILLDFSFVMPTLTDGRDEGGYQVHRLVSLWTRVNIIQTENHYSTVLEAVSESFGEPDITNLHNCTSLLPHTMSILTHSKVSEEHEWQRTWLSYRVAKHHYHAQRLKEAGNQFQDCLDFFQDYNDKEDDDFHMLDCIQYLGAVFRGQGEYDEALEWYERALVGYEKALGKEHPSTLDTVNNIAVVFQDQGKYDEALEWFERALAGKEKALGKDHLSTLDTVNNMANVFRIQGKYDEALEWFERALAGCEKALGKEHPSTLATMYSFGALYKVLQDYEQSLEYFNAASQGYEKALGANCKWTLHAKASIARINMHLNPRPRNLGISKDEEDVESKSLSSCGRSTLSETSTHTKASLAHVNIQPTALELDKLEKSEYEGDITTESSTNLVQHNSFVLWSLVSPGIRGSAIRDKTLSSSMLSTCSTSSTASLD